MPQVIYNLEKVPNDIWKKKTVFLIGPSPRGQTNVKSYREEFIKHLTQVELETDNEYVVFNPEGPNWENGKASEFAKWELERLEQSSVIVLALNMDDNELPGLTTRTEIGFLLANRRNLILWRPPTSFQTGYICGRFLERPYLVATNDLRDSARLVPLIYQRNEDNIEVREGNFSSIEVRPDGCDYYFLETTLRKVEEENTMGAIYLYLPLFDTYGYAGVVEKLGGYKPFVQSEKYNILYKWNNNDYMCRVPEPGSSISGAFGMFLSPDEKQCLLIYETKFGRARWGFVGGAVDRRELDIEAFEKEIHAETGVNFKINLDNTFITGGYNQKSARVYGVWDSSDPPVLINNHFTIYLMHVPTSQKFIVEETGEETGKIKWFPVDDLLQGRISSLNPYSQRMLLDYFQNKRKLTCSRPSENIIKFN